MTDQSQSVLSDDDIRRVLRMHTGDLGSLATRMMHLQRRDEEAARRANAPKLNLRTLIGEAEYGRLLQVVLAEFRKALRDDEKVGAKSGLDMWLLNLQDTADAGDLEDFLLATVRLARRTWGSQFVHLGLDPDPATWPAAAKRDFGR
jgi:hypothetical protein